MKNVNINKKTSAQDQEFQLKEIKVVANVRHLMNLTY